MKGEILEFFLTVMRALESSPFKDVAAKLRERLEDEVEDTRIDFLGNKHERDLSSYMAKYPNLNYSNVALSDASRKLLHLRTVATPHYRPTINMYHRIRARKLRGPVPTSRTLPIEFYTKYEMHKKIMGHLSAVYCVSFDQTGQYVFTGADDHLVKVWCSRTGRLIKTLRGHDGQVCDMSVNYENRLLATAGMDKIIRIWDLKSSKLLECLTSHSATVTSVKFAPYNRHGEDRYLVSTSNDGYIVIWSYHVERFGFKKLAKVQERNRPGGQMTCSSFSAGGSFLACGASDNYIHVYGFHPEQGPYHVKELLGHADKVDSVQFCNLGARFISGSKDGTAIIWKFKDNNWKPLKLDMDTQLNQRVVRQRENQRPPMVMIVQWSRDDRYVMTSLVDYSIKVWNSTTGELVHILREHKHDIYLLESHPTDSRIFVSASHDGTLCIWDINTGKCLKKIYNHVKEAADARTPAAIYDIKFSPDGTMLAATDSYGYLTLLGTGGHDLYKQIPEQMFFSSDYRPLIRDVHHFVMDENTHVAPHLMPRPVLVDMNGIPYPNYMQKLVPDHQKGQRNVIPPLNPAQLKSIASVIEIHSLHEDQEYLAEKSDQPMEQNYDSEATEVYDSDATEIDDEYAVANFANAVPYQHNLRSRSYGREPERRTRRHSARLRCNKRMRR